MPEHRNRFCRGEKQNRAVSWCFGVILNIFVERRLPLLPHGNFIGIDKRQTHINLLAPFSVPHLRSTQNLSLFFTFLSPFFALSSIQFQT